MRCHFPDLTRRVTASPDIPDRTACRRVTTRAWNSSKSINVTLRDRAMTIRLTLPLSSDRRLPLTVHYWS
jgi:hypothetical protein